MRSYTQLKDVQIESPDRQLQDGDKNCSIRFLEPEVCSFKVKCFDLYFSGNFSFGTFRLAFSRRPVVQQATPWQFHNRRQTIKNKIIKRFAFFFSFFKRKKTKYICIKKIYESQKRLVRLKSTNPFAPDMHRHGARPRPRHGPLAGAWAYCRLGPWLARPLVLLAA